MRQLIKNSIVTLLNPVSPIITLFIGWILTILVTQPNEKFPDFINFMINNPYLLIIIIALWLISAVIYTHLQNIINKLLAENNKKDVIIREKDEQLKHMSGVVYNRSGDFANFSKLLRFKEVLKDFTENNTIVECAQMYSYSTKRVDKIVNIKISNFPHQ